MSSENPYKEIKEEFPEQSPDVISDLNNITLSELTPGVLNPVTDGGSTAISLWNPDDKLTSTIQAVQSMVDSPGRLSAGKYMAVVALNPTPLDDNDFLVGEIREMSKDSEYRLGFDRAYCHVLVPELHMSNKKVNSLLPSDLTMVENKSLELLPKAWGARKFVKKLTPGMFLEIEFKDPKDKEYAQFTAQEGVPSVHDKKVYDFESEGKKSPKNKMKNPKSKKMGGSRPVRNAPGLKEAEKKLLNLPPPKERPSPRSKNVYHTAVDKSLLIGPSPRGYIDWTGCGGRGTLSMSGGKPKSGPKRYYLKGNESDASGNLIIDVPSDLCLGPALKGHRAIIEPLRAMLEQARVDGIPAPLFKIYSCWRSVERQHEGFKYWFYSKYGGNKKYPIYSRQNEVAYRKCRKYNGDPFDPRLKGNIGGDHMAGRGIDLFLGIQQNAWCGRYQKRNPNVSRGASIRAFKEFMKSKASYQWLKINAEFFGFYNYPAEPWHWCYNPDDRQGRQSEPLELS